MGERYEFYISEDYDIWKTLDISIREKFSKLKDISI
ncbi:hypothetical protein [Salmonella phage NINP13076]|nr:hypothetical protein [Salmonella phage NINP13076]